jgi:hypothetical protein
VRSPRAACLRANAPQRSSFPRRRTRCIPLARAKEQPLNEARVPFASYLNDVHARIHPRFSDGFIVSLDKLPASDPRNTPTLFAMLAVVIDGKTGASKVSR